MVLYIKRVAILLSIATLSCNKTDKTCTTFADDLAIVQENTTAIVLAEGNSRVLITPEYEARVLTSSTNGDKGYSNGFLNYEKIKENKIHIGGNPYGGEDRLWIAPLGSKFTLFYGQKPIKDANWHVPKAFDAEAYSIQSQTKSSVIFTKETTITNNLGTHFKINIDRKISIYSKEKIQEKLNLKLDNNLKYVGFSSRNRITNIGDDWKEENGIIAPWVLGMFKGNSISTSIFPYSESKEYPLKTSKYLKDLKEDRLIKKEHVLLYKTDGAYRSKIGIKPENTIPLIGNYDVKNNVLTVITFSFNKNGRFLSSDDRDLKNGLWNGDVVNSYNNSPTDKGIPTFYELESASEAKVLKKEESVTHTHNTFHFSGDKKALNKLCLKIFKSTLDEISLH